MKQITRRNFLKTTAATGAVMTALPRMAHAKIRGANEDIRLAVVGVGGQGSNHCKYFGSIKGVRLVGVCDIDPAQIERCKKKIADSGLNMDPNFKGYQDFRQVLDNQDIDAITSATPNHWHSLLTILACQAGKDVYIEKPVCHNIWEGRKMVEAARKYNRIVQTGTQKRSSEAHPAAYDWIRQGHIGKLTWVRGLCYKKRYEGSNGIVHGTNGPNPLPKDLDYNTWCGPADMEPLHRENLHYKWHWVWSTGNGDLGNQGIHEMDLARWALGDPKLAPRVMSFGGRFRVNDAGETPNTQVVFLDYKPAPLIFEVRGLARKKGDASMDNWRRTGTRIGVVAQCEKGYWSAGDAGGYIWDNNDKRTSTKFEGEGGRGHHENFIKAVRSQKVSDLNADIECGHYSSSLCHLGNISYLLGQKLSVADARKCIDNEYLLDSFDRMVEHLKANEVDLDKEPITMGPMLSFDPESEQFTGDLSTEANMYLARNYREPFVVPHKV